MKNGVIVATFSGAVHLEVGGGGVLVGQAAGAGEDQEGGQDELPGGGGHRQE